MDKPLHGRAQAFTLVELLVVIGIIALLIAVLMPALSRARKEAYKIKCASNIHQIMTACITRCSDYPKRPVLIPNTDGGEDSLGDLFPRYIKDYNVAVCPATQNYIRTDPANMLPSDGRYWFQEPKDITVAANDINSPGHSYEPFAWYSNGVWPDGRVIVGQKVGGLNAQLGLTPADPRYAKTAAADTVGGVAKRLGKLYDPVRTILLMDVDKDSAAMNAAVMNNWPDPKNNHGNEGFNFGFADGHVAFVRRGPEIILTFLRSYQGMAQNDFFTQSHCPGLTMSSTIVSGITMTKYSYRGNDY